MFYFFGFLLVYLFQFEVISRQFCIIILQDDIGIICSCRNYLKNGELKSEKIFKKILNFSILDFFDIKFFMELE